MLQFIYEKVKIILLVRYNKGLPEMTQWAEVLVFILQQGSGVLAKAAAPLLVGGRVCSGGVGAQVHSWEGVKENGGTLGGGGHIKRPTSVWLHLQSPLVMVLNRTQSVCVCARGSEGVYITHNVTEERMHKLVNNFCHQTILTILHHSQEQNSIFHIFTHLRRYCKSAYCCCK